MSARGERSDGTLPEGGTAPPSLPPPSSESPIALQPGVLAGFHRRFEELAGPDSGLDAGELRCRLDVESVFLAERVLAVFDRNRDGRVCRVEFVRRVPRLLFGSVLDRLRFAFRLHDLNGDGVIDRAELVRMLELGLCEDGVAAGPEVVARLCDLLLGAADRNRDGRVSFSEFEAVAAQHPEAVALIAHCEAGWIAPGLELSEVARPAPSLGRRLARFVDNHPALVVVTALWAFANVLLFARALFEQRALGENAFVQLARGCGACINLNGALILLPMARRVLTWARRTPGLRRLPLDDSVAIHRWLGGWLFGLVLVHSAAHVANWATTTPSAWVALTQHRAGPSGVLLLLVFAAIWAFSRPRVRASGHFELFYWSHLLYLVWFALALAHGPVFWMWAGVPLVLFGVDRLTRYFRGFERTEVLGCEPLASRVTKLTLERPPDFSHQAGDYVYLKFPALAPHEWHPFTISSAPEQRHLTLHVRDNGNFTKRLHTFAEERTRLTRAPALHAFLDGPFGTASQRVFEARHAVLIGAGIGVTPFASVLESLVLRGRAAQGSLEKVFFFWQNSDAISFEWFAKLLASLERDAPKGLVELRIFMTGGRGHLSATFLNLAREIAHAYGDPDLITGLGAKTRLGRPNWHAELAPLAQDYPGTLEVFFCGPPGLAPGIRAACSELGIGFQQE